MEGLYERVTGDDACFKIECGNGIINTGEQCDDANKNNGDGCSSNCTVEVDGFNCISLTYTNPTFCLACAKNCRRCTGPNI